MAPPSLASSPAAMMHEFSLPGKRGTDARPRFGAHTRHGWVGAMTRPAPAPGSPRTRRALSGSCARPVIHGKPEQEILSADCRRCHSKVTTSVVKPLLTRFLCLAYDSRTVRPSTEPGTVALCASGAGASTGRRAVFDLTATGREQHDGKGEYEAGAKYHRHKELPALMSEPVEHARPVCTGSTGL